MTALQLLELLQDAVEDSDVVTVVAPSLGHIVQGAPTPTLQALEKQDAITMLAYVIKKQQGQVCVQQQQDQVCTAAGSGVYSSSSSSSSSSSRGCA